MGPGDLAFCCDLVRLVDGRMAEAPARSPEAESLIAAAGPIAARLTLQLAPVGEALGVLVYREGWPFDLRTTDPATILNQPAADHRPRGAGDEVMRDLMESSSELFGEGRQLWVWDGGPLPVVPPMHPEGIIVGRDPALAGLARLVGWGHRTE